MPFLSKIFIVFYSIILQTDRLKTWIIGCVPRKPHTNSTFFCTSSLASYVLFWCMYVHNSVTQNILTQHNTHSCTLSYLFITFVKDDGSESQWSLFVLFSILNNIIYVCLLFIVAGFILNWKLGTYCYKHAHREAYQTMHFLHQKIRYIRCPGCSKYKLNETYALLLLRLVSVSDKYII